MVSTINDLATRCDWFLPGLGEGKILTGLSTPEEIADYYLERGVSLVVIKLGLKALTINPLLGKVTWTDSRWSRLLIRWVQVMDLRLA